MPHFLDLPAEIQCRIFYHLSHPPDLHASTLLCRQSYPQAQSALDAFVQSYTVRAAPAQNRLFERIACEGVRRALGQIVGEENVRMRANFAEVRATVGEAQRVKGVMLVTHVVQTRKIAAEARIFKEQECA